MHSSTTNSNPNARAFSFAELLTVIAVIIVFGTVCVIAAGMMGRTVQKAKLQQDIKTLNAALAVYTSNGGDLTGLVNPTNILNKLKTARGAADQKLHTFATSGQLIDPRIIALPVESTDWKARAIYSPTKKRFVLADSTTSGFWFDLDEQPNEMALPAEKPDHGVVIYAESETLVEDHGPLNNRRGEAGPDRAYTFQAPPNSDPGDGDNHGNGRHDNGTGGNNDGLGGGVYGDTVPEPDPVPEIPQLPYPAFNLAGGAFPDTNFPLELSLTNVPDASISNALIQVGSEAWKPYTGPVSIPMNKGVKAQYRTVDATQYKDSGNNSQYFYPIVSSLSGSVSGTFHTPQGGDNLDSDVTEGGSFFSNGDPTIDLEGEVIDAGEPNTLRFNSGNVSEVAPGEQFVIGNLVYHNGTTFNDSHATGVTLKLQIQLENPTQTLQFDLKMDLVNTDNTSDADASADYVKLTILNQAVPLSINGVDYQIQLEFGGADSFGFASSNQFHVYEGATGQGELRATFVANP